MKKIKNVIAVIIALISFLTSINVFAADKKPPVAIKPIILSSDVTDNMTAASKLGIITETTDKGSVVTRKELCRLIVRFHRASTGGIGITISNSPFYDCDSNEVVFCYENGIISGIGDVTFAPDYYVSREEACLVVMNAIKASGGNIINPERDYTIMYKDKDDISDKYKEAVSYLTSAGIVNGYSGYFYPKSYITYEQAASMLVEAYYQFMLSKINICGYDISIGDSEEKIKQYYGEPDYRIKDDLASLDLWVYNKNMADLFYVAFRDGKVAEIFSNGTTFRYRGINSGTDVGQLDFGARAKVVRNNAIYKDGYGIVEIGSFSGDNKISYVYAGSAEKWNRHNMTANTKELDSQLLLDIINSERRKNGLDSFIINKKLMSTTNTHSMDMGYWNYVGVNDKDGTTPFIRFNNKDLKYKMASENVEMINGSVVDVYIKWMSSAGSRSNLMTDYMDNIGIGIDVRHPNGTAYVVMDFMKLA